MFVFFPVLPYTILLISSTIQASAFQFIYFLTLECENSNRLLRIYLCIFTEVTLVYNII